MKPHLVVATTVAETLATILKDQPRHLSQRFQVSLATSTAAGTHTVSEGDAVEVYPVRMERGISIGRDLASVVEMARLFRKLRPDVVHSYTPKAGLVCMVAAFLARVPLRVHTFTGLIFPTATGGLQKLLIWIDRLICLCATHVVPEGAGVAADLRCFGITRKPLQVIGHGNIAGVDTSHFSPAAPGIAEQAELLRDTLAVPAGAFVFCFVGRLNRDKGIEELAQAFGSLPGNSFLLIAGAHDETSPVSDYTLAALSSHPRIKLTGFLNDIRPLLALSDILVLPSYREGFPNVLLQAGAMSLPAIASDINGCNEIVEPSFNGWLVPSRDATALAAAMRDAAACEAGQLLALGANARRRVAERFERTDHWVRMEEFYAGLLGERDRTGTPAR